MRIFIALSFFIASIGTFLSQDTTWVQTFTFDSISNRHDQFTFPASLDTQRFEKVLMYYKLKCSPLTTWDQYDCGEWDYLTYTRVFDHTGNYDSTKKEGPKYLSNFQTPALINYNSALPSSLAIHQYDRIQKSRSGEILTDFQIGRAHV